MGHFKAGFIFFLLLAISAQARVQAEEPGPTRILIPDPESRFVDKNTLADMGDHLRSLAARYPSLAVLKVPGMGLKEMRKRVRCRGSGVACLARIARKAKADRILHAEVQKLPGRYLVVMRLVDAESAKVLEQARKRSRRDQESVRNALLKGWVDLQGPLVRSQLKVVANVGGAEILLDGRRIGYTPLVLTKDLGRGAHVIEVRREGYEAVQREVKIEEDSGFEVEVELKKIAVVSKRPIVEASPEVEPEPGRKLGDDKEDTETTLVSAQPPINGHKAGTGSGGETAGMSVESTRPFLPGSTDTRDNNDRSGDSSPVYKQWWFWTAIGVVVAGGVAGLVVGLSGDAEIPSGKGRVSVQFW